MKNKKAFTLLILGIVAVALFSPLPVAAVPIIYDYSDVAWDGSAGTGMFTLDIDTALGTYLATGFSGGPGTFLLSVWDSVRFRAESGFLADLTITSGLRTLIEPGFFAIGGGNVLPGSTAIAEWENLILDLQAIHVSITPRTSPNSVPEPSTMLLLGSGLLGLVGLRREFKK